MPPSPGIDDLHAFIAKACNKPSEVLHVGIDPGADGAIGFVNTDGKQGFVLDIPTLTIERDGSTRKKKKTKTVFNLPAIVDVLSLLKTASPCRVFVVLEEAQVQVKGKGANAYTGYRVGVAYALWTLHLTALAMAHDFISFSEVHPAKWKRAMKLWGKDKEAARHMALKWWPRADIKRKMDHNRAEALLLAEYGRSTL